MNHVLRQLNGGIKRNVILYDDRPRKAIEAARKCIKRNTKKNRKAAYSAYSAAKRAMQKKILKYGIKLLKEEV